MANNPDQPCGVCGANPAIKVRFIKMQGLLVIRRIWWSKGYFCQECGLRRFEEFQAFLKARGWWSLYGPAFTPLYMSQNKKNANKLRQLQAPIRARASVQPDFVPPDFVQH